MKKLFLVLALLCLITSGAQAASCNPNRDKLTVGQWCVNSQDTLIPSTTAGMQIVYDTQTTSEGTTKVLSAEESGMHILDTAGAKFLLPRAEVGLTYTISSGYQGNSVSNNRVTSTVDTLDTSDIIVYSISGTKLDAGDSIKSTGQAGDAVTVTCPIANTWMIKDMKAVWTDNGTN